MRALWVMAATFLVWGCAASSSPRAAPLIPSPCVGNDTIYSRERAGATGELHLASPLVATLPPRTFRGRAVLHILVSALGRVVRDSTQVTGVSSREDSLSLARSVDTDQFYPARLGTCAVTSWTNIQVTRE